MLTGRVRSKAPKELKLGQRVLRPALDFAAECNVNFVLLQLNAANYASLLCILVTAFLAGYRHALLVHMKGTRSLFG